MNTNLATKFFEKLIGGDVEGALTFTTDDFTWTVGGKPGGPFALAGMYDRAGFSAMMGHVQASVPGGSHVDVTSVTADDEHIVIESRVLGTSADEVHYDNHVVQVLDIADGKIAAVREYLDTAHAAEVFTR